ncbi:hypothetical protein GCM10023185_20930 [Hymenobacter saemangeumensis]|uniref:Uncharacterized protein n=1 Tax=Hymenobacter saemangeumensis TaxID=1084522 RepID=A0ABP8IDU3_9BACT
MPSYSLLTDRSLCDTAIAEVDFELKTYTTRDAVGELADDRASRTQTSTAAQLASVNAKIAVADAVLAAPGIDDELRETTTDERAALLVRRTALSKRNRQASGVTRFLAELDAEQIDGQVAILNAARAGIVTHRATLPA